VEAGGIGLPARCPANPCKSASARKSGSGGARGRWAAEPRDAGRRPETVRRFRSRTTRKTERTAVDAGPGDARSKDVDVVLRKLGKGARSVGGRLVRAPRKGSVVVIEFPDGMHEYVTTPVKRVLRIAGREVFYIETINSRYRLEVRGREAAAAEGTG